MSRFLRFSTPLQGNAAQRLSGGWLLATDPNNAGRTERWFEKAPDGTRPAPVPGIIQQVFPDYHGVAWYWRSFRPARKPASGERLLLRFGAVDYMAEVWVNGEPAGGHEGGETPFTLDVTGLVQTERDNLLAVRVLNPTDEPIEGIALGKTPHRNKRLSGYQPGASYNYGGILLPVDLVLAPEVRIADVFVRSDVKTGDVRLAVTVRNDTGRSVAAALTAGVGPKETGEVQVSATIEADAPAGDSEFGLELNIDRPRLWNLDDPQLYVADVNISAATGEGAPLRDSKSVRFGFRDFQVAGGYFQLNGKRLFLRSTHTGNHFPIGQIVPVDPDHMRRDLLYAKTCGFNTIRFIAGMPWPEQLDFCDEIGLMVYEENLAGWCLEDSPEMADRFTRSTREMILRDRNHPSVVIWGLLNETPDGPVFRHAAGSLPMVRELDETRLVLLGSGRWDCQPGIGSISNPGSADWEHEWGIEAPGAPPVSNEWDGRHGGYFDRAGDAHVYPSTPLPAETRSFLRDLGAGTKPVFLSEFGTGSLFNAADELRKYTEAGARPDIPDAALIRSMLEKLQADWTRFGMEGVYPFVEDFFRDSYRLHVRQRRLNFDLVRSNPRLCGYNITGCLDHGVTGEGLWTLWREFKPGIADALRDGWAPLRWCLFVEPRHGCAGRGITLEAVLANEDVLPPGDYPVRFRIHGRDGIVWQKRASVRIPDPASGECGPLAVPALKEEVRLDVPAGVYTFAASLESGGAPSGDRIQFFISCPADLPGLEGRAALWGVAKEARDRLEAHGLQCDAFPEAPAREQETILVGAPENTDDTAWAELTRRVRQGATAVFLSPAALRKGDDSTAHLPLHRKGRCYDFHDWLYHKECVAKRHPAFDGLQAGGILDWDYYDQVIPHAIFDGQDTPDEVIAAAFAVGYSCPGGYASGILMGTYKVDAGRIVINTMRILEHVDHHPAADRLLINLVRYAQGKNEAAL